MKNKEYALYKGDELLMMGTLDEIAKDRGIKRSSLLFYKYPAYQRRNEKSANRLVLVEV